MLTVSKEQILQSLRTNSPWWEDRGDVRWKEAPKRAYFTEFFNLVTKKTINRAVVLMGPRRVGKTVMIHQSIAELIKQAVKPEQILYAPLDNPLYSGLSLEEILLMFCEMKDGEGKEPRYLFFDEIQYLGNWERHLKSLVDTYPQHRFIATGSAAAALKLKSDESGAGRFTDFILPPLTFYEYITFSEREEKLFKRGKDFPLGAEYPMRFLEKIERLNKEFVNYVNFGGYPEAVFSEEIRANPGRFIRNDIVEKVLLRDLPSLYGISDIRGLNRLFTTLVRNTGQEIDLPDLSSGSNVAKGTISKYLEYLEAAFLIRRISRIDKTARKFQREHKFKIYVANPSMYTALFGTLEKNNSTVFGKLAETSVFGHFFHFTESSENPYYARWRNGEVDLVTMDATGVTTAVEVKWSDRPFNNASEIKGLLDFAEKHRTAGLKYLFCCTLSKLGWKQYGDKRVLFFPTSLFCFLLGKFISRPHKECLIKFASEQGA